MMAQMMAMANDMSVSQRNTKRTKLDSNVALNQLFKLKKWPSLRALIVAYYHEIGEWEKLTYKKRKDLSNSNIYSINSFDEIHGVFRMINSKLSNQNLDMTKTIGFLTGANLTSTVKLMQVNTEIICQLDKFYPIAKAMFPKYSPESYCLWFDSIMIEGFFDRTIADIHYKYAYMLDSNDFDSSKNTKDKNKAKPDKPASSKNNSRDKPEIPAKAPKVSKNNTKNENKSKKSNKNKKDTFVHCDDKDFIPNTSIPFKKGFCNFWQTGFCNRGPKCYFVSGHKCSLCDSPSHGAHECMASPA